MQSSEEEQQLEALKIFFETTGESDTSAKQTWKTFVDKYELDQQKYGSLEKLIDDCVSEKVKVRELGNYVLKLIGGDDE